MATGYAPGVLRSVQESLHDNNRTRALPQGADIQVQNVKAARVYVFGDGNLAEDDGDEVTEFEMRSRHRNAFSAQKEDPKPIFFEKQISEGDTLQAIALKYACNVSELKRLNNLIQDQEFFALKVVKIPMTRHGILSEKIDRNEMETAQNIASSSLCNGLGSQSEYEDDTFGGINYDSESQHDFSDPETQMKVLRTLSIRENFSSQGREAEKFLRKMDSDLSKLKKPPRGERESLTEVISMLTNKSIHPLSTSSKVNKHNGADCGISWWSILIFTLIIAIVVPSFYLIYSLVAKETP